MKGKKKEKKEVSLVKLIRGFSLVELIVVLTIMAIIAALCAPNIAAYVKAAKIQNYQTALNNLVGEVQTQLPQSRYWNWQEVQENAEAILRSDSARGVKDVSSEKGAAANQKIYEITNASSDANIVYYITLEYENVSSGTSQKVKISADCAGYDLVSANETCDVTLKANYTDADSYPQVRVSTITTTNKGGWKSLDDFARPRSEWETLLNPATPDYAEDWSEFDFLMDTLVGGNDSDVILNTTEYPANSISAVRFTMNLYTTKKLINGNYYLAWPSVQVQDGQGTGAQYSACGTAGFDNLYVYIGSDNDYDNSDNWVAWNDTFYDGTVDGQGCFILRTVTGNGIYPADVSAENYHTLTDESKTFYDKYLSSGGVSPKVEYKINLIDPNGLQNSRGWISLICGNDPNAWSDSDSGTAGAGTYPENPYLFLNRADSSNTEPEIFNEDRDGNPHAGTSGFYLDQTNLIANGDGTYTDTTNGVIVTYNNETGESSVRIAMPRQENAGAYAAAVLEDERGHYIPYYENGDRLVDYQDGVVVVTINLPEKTDGYYKSIYADVNGDSYVSYVHNTAIDSHGNALTYQNGVVHVSVSLPMYNDGGWYGDLNDIVYEDGHYKIPYFIGWQNIGHWLDLSSYVDNDVLSQLTSIFNDNGLLDLAYPSDTNPCEERIYLYDLDAVYDENQTETLHSWNNTLEIRYESADDPRPVKKVYLEDDLDVDYSARYYLNPTDDTLTLDYSEIGANRYVKNYTTGEFYLDISNTGYLVNDRLKITFTNVNADKFIDSFNLVMQVTGTFQTHGSFLGGIDRSEYTIQPGSDPNTVDIIMDMKWAYYPFFYISYAGGLSDASVGVECSVTWLSETTSTENVEISTSIPMVTINGNDSYANVTLDWSRCDYITAANVGNMHLEFNKNLDYQVYNKNYDVENYSDIYGKNTFYLNQLGNMSGIIADGIVHLYCRDVDASSIVYELKDAPTPPETIETTPAVTTAPTETTTTTVVAATETSVTTVSTTTLLETTVVTTVSTVPTESSVVVPDVTELTLTEESEETTAETEKTTFSTSETEKTGETTYTVSLDEESAKVCRMVSGEVVGNAYYFTIEPLSGYAFSDSVTVYANYNKYGAQYPCPGSVSNGWYVTLSEDSSLHVNGIVQVEATTTDITSAVTTGVISTTSTEATSISAAEITSVTTTETTTTSSTEPASTTTVSFENNDLTKITCAAYNQQTVNIDTNQKIDRVVMHIEHTSGHWEYYRIQFDDKTSIKAGWFGDSYFEINGASGDLRGEIDQDGNLTVYFLNEYQPPSSFTVVPEADVSENATISVYYAAQTVFFLSPRPQPISAFISDSKSTTTNTAVTTITTTTTETTATTTESPVAASENGFNVGLDTESAEMCTIAFKSPLFNESGVCYFTIMPKEGYTLSENYTVTVGTVTLEHAGNYSAKSNEWYFWKSSGLTDYTIHVNGITADTTS